MTTEEDLRLVAEAVGLQRVEITNTKDEPVGFRWIASTDDGKFVFWDSDHPRAPNLHNDDGLAAKHLLPWLQQRFRGASFSIGWDCMSGWGWDGTGLGGRDSSVGHDSLAAALFDLCLQLAKENMTDTTNWHCQTCGTTASSGHECSYEAMVDALAEARRKAAHYHAQRVEADERNACLEDALAEAAKCIEDAVGYVRRDRGESSHFDAIISRCRRLLK